MQSRVYLPGPTWEGGTLGPEPARSSQAGPGPRPVQLGLPSPDRQQLLLAVCSPAAHAMVQLCPFCLPNWLEIYSPIKSNPAQIPPCYMDQQTVRAIFFFVDPRVDEQYSMAQAGLHAK